MSEDQPEWIDGECALCHQCKTEEGHDPCIANLPGVMYACCGHGTGDGYIKFVDGRTIRFDPKEVDLDLPTANSNGAPFYQLGSNRKLDFVKKKVTLDEWYKWKVVRVKRSN